MFFLNNTKQHKFLDFKTLMVKNYMNTSYYPNKQKAREIPYVNEQRHGVAIWWHSNGNKWQIMPYTKGQIHGLVTVQHLCGSLSWIQKWHQNQWVWEMHFPSKKQIPEDVEVELFFHATPELI